jgi:hypothetical protein
VNLAHGHPARDDGFLAASDRRFELFGRERPLAYELLENFGGHRHERRVRRQCFASTGHRGSSCYAPTHEISDTPLDPKEKSLLCSSSFLRCFV